MEFYNETGKTKTGELRITRPIGAVLIKMSQNFAALSNETITAFIERANGNNTTILTDVPLKAFIAASTSGQSSIFEEDQSLTALLEICENGSINLQDTESIKIKLDGLKSAVTYTLFGIEFPTYSDDVISISRKNLLAGETDRLFDVHSQELMVIEGVDSLLEMNVAFSNGKNCKYIPEEIKAISRDLDAVKLVTIGATPSVAYDLAGLITFPLVEVNTIDIKKKSGEAVTIYLKNDVVTFSN